MEEQLIIKIRGGITQIEAGNKSPKEAGVGKYLNKLKGLNEGMYDELLERYKKAVENYKEEES